SSATPLTPPNDYWNFGHAFLYTSGILYDLNALNATPGWELRKASGINDSGEIVGYGAVFNLSTIHAFRYAGGQTTDLGTFPGGGISYALGINNGGTVVGAAYLDASGIGNFRAMVHQDGVMRNLNDLIPQGSGWELREATAV